MAEKSVITAPALVVIGGSAGSLDIFLQLLPQWNPDPRIAVVIVLHRRPDGESILSSLLQSKTNWPLQEVKDKDDILPGNIYLAPPDYHLLVEANDTFSLDYSEKINYSRPCIDATFETAALAYRNRLICVLLSGANTDGTLGLLKAQDQQALILIQDPATAIAAFMPQNAANLVTDGVLIRPEEIISKINNYLDRLSVC